MNLVDLIRKLECGPIDVCTAQAAAAALSKLRAEVLDANAETVAEEKVAAHWQERAERAETVLVQPSNDGMDFWRWREKNPDASVFDAWQAGFDNARGGDGK